MLEEAISYKNISEYISLDRNANLEEFTYAIYPDTGFLLSVPYEEGNTYIFDKNYINRLGEGLDKKIVGGEGVNNNLYSLRDVYGINADGKVWYINADGKILGAEEIIDMPIDTSTQINMPNDVILASGLNDKATIGDTRGLQNLVLDGSLANAENIKNLDFISVMPNLQTLTLKNLTSLENLEGLKYLRNLNTITFENTISKDYMGFKYASNVIYVEFRDNSINTDNFVNIANGLATLESKYQLYIRYNEKLNEVMPITSLGKVETLYITNNTNLKSIMGLQYISGETVTSLTKMSLEGNKLTDTQNTENLYDNTYSDGKIINFMALYKFVNLQELILGTTNKQNIYYLSGIVNGEERGINNLSSLKRLELSACNLYNIDALLSFENKVDSDENQLTYIDLNNNTNMKLEAVAKLNKLITNYTVLLDGKYGYLTQPYAQSETPTNYTNEEFIARYSTEEAINTVQSLSITRGEDTLTNTAEDNRVGECISKLKNLKTLNLGNGATDGFEEYSFIDDLPNLEILSFYGNSSVTSAELEKLQVCSNVKSITCSTQNKFSSLNWIEKFPNIEFIELNAIDLDLTPLNQCSKLRQLVWGSYSENWNPVNGNVNQIQALLNSEDRKVILDCRYSINVFKQLENCTNLTKVNAFIYSSSSGEHLYKDVVLNLNKLTDLKEIYISAQFKGCFGGILLENCTKLEKIEIIQGATNLNTKMQLSRLNSCKNLKSIILKNCRIDDAMFNTLCQDLAEVNSLETLNLAENKISNLEPIGYLSNNNSVGLNLDFQKNQILYLGSDTTGISVVPNISSLNLSNNVSLSNILPVLKQRELSGSKLMNLNIKNCSLSDSSKNSLKELNWNNLEI